MATAHMLNLDKVALAEQAGMVQYVKQCQVCNPLHSSLCVLKPCPVLPELHTKLMHIFLKAAL